MRVVGGEHRSRRLLVPPEGVRPTADRVRESLFSWIGDVQDARVLDLFAGTGALAIEALSRGAREAVLIDASARAIDVVRGNLRLLGLEDRAVVIRSDALRGVRRLSGGDPFDLAFLDPPYESDRLAPTLAAVVEAGLLRPHAAVVVETAKRHSLPPVSGLAVVEERSYGDTRLTWLAPEARPQGGDGQPDEDGPGAHERTEDPHRTLPGELRSVDERSSGSDPPDPTRLR